MLKKKDDWTAVTIFFVHIWANVILFSAFFRARARPV